MSEPGSVSDQLRPWPNEPTWATPPPPKGSGLRRGGLYVLKHPWVLLIGLGPATGLTAIILGLTNAANNDGQATGAHGHKAGLVWWVDQRDTYGTDESRPAAWPADKIFAVAAKGAVTGYDSANGIKRWSIPLTGEVCGSSAKPENDRIAVLSGAGKFCDSLIVIDLKKGTKAWSRKLPATTPSSGRTDKVEEVVIGDGVVALDRLGEGTEAFRLTDGRPLWTKEGVSSGPDCHMTALGGGGALLAVEECGLGVEANPTVHRLDPKTGASRWAYRLPFGTDLTGVFSAGPTVLGIGDSGTEQVVILDDKGTERKRIKLGSAAHVDCAFSQITWCEGAVVDGSTLYLQSTKGSFSSYWITAYDVTTGAQKWQSASMRSAVRPVAVDGGLLIAAHSSTAPRKRNYSRDPAEVMAIDPRTGKAKGLLWVPTSMTGIDELIETRGDLFYFGDRFYLVHMTGPEPRMPGIAVLTAKPGN